MIRSLAVRTLSGIRYWYRSACLATGATEELHTCPPTSRSYPWASIANPVCVTTEDTWSGPSCLFQVHNFHRSVVWEYDNEIKATGYEIHTALFLCKWVNWFVSLAQHATATRQQHPKPKDLSSTISVTTIICCDVSSRKPSHLPSRNVAWRSK